MEQVPESKKVSPFLVYYLIISVQVGIGVLGFQRIIAKEAGYDAWISVILSGLLIHLIIFIIYKLLELGGGDFTSIHRMIFGRKLGGFLSSVFSLYYLIAAIVIIRTYIEVIQVWMFPDYKLFWSSVLIMGLIIYIIYGGFRTITGFSFLGTILPSYLVLTFLFTIPYSDFHNLLPIFNHSWKEIMGGVFQMGLTVIGFETLLFYYPMIKEPEKSKKYAHYAIITSTLFYLFITLLSFSYFSENQIQNTIWATLTMWKVVQLPFVERFEYIGIANWGLVVLPNICITLWCSAITLKRVYRLKLKKGSIAVCAICLFTVPFIDSRAKINLLNDLLSKVGFIYVFVYIPFLLVLLLIVRKVKKL